MWLHRTLFQVEVPLLELDAGLLGAGLSAFVSFFDEDESELEELLVDESAFSDFL